MLTGRNLKLDMILVREILLKTDRKIPRIHEGGEHNSLSTPQTKYGVVGTIANHCQETGVHNWKLLVIR